MMSVTMGQPRTRLTETLGEWCLNITSGSRKELQSDKDVN